MITQDRLPTTAQARKRKSSGPWLFLGMALQNMQRRPTRTIMLILSVALGAAAMFASYAVSRGVMTSTETSFSRMGADLVVVPANTMVNITSALLTVQPTEERIDPSVLAEIAKLDGITNVSTQTIYKVGVMAGMPEHKENLIAYDPRNDFTVQPWLVSKLDRTPSPTDLVIGGRRAGELGDEVQICGQPATIYGKLGRSGVGPLDDSMFAPYDTVEKLTQGSDACVPPFERSRISAILLRLKFGVAPEQIKFAVARIPGVKVIQGAQIVTATRQTTTLMFYGLVCFSAIMILGSMILVGLLFSSVVSERRREIGVLKAIGARRSDLLGMLVFESSTTTFVGGLIGIATGCVILFVFQNSLVYFLQTLHIEFTWPGMNELLLAGLGCVAITTVVGFLAALIPAWRSSSSEPYLLIQREDAGC